MYQNYNTVQYIDVLEMETSQLFVGSVRFCLGNQSVRIGSNYCVF